MSEFRRKNTVNVLEQGKKIHRFFLFQRNLTPKHQKFILDLFLLNLHLRVMYNVQAGAELCQAQKVVG